MSHFSQLHEDQELMKLKHLESCQNIVTANKYIVFIIITIIIIAFVITVTIIVVI